MINQKKFSIIIKKPYAQWLNLKFNQILLHQVLILYIYIIIFFKKKDLVMNHFTYFLLNLIRYYIREKI